VSLGAAGFEEAFEWTKAHFPIEGWFAGCEVMYRAIARTVCQHVPQAGRILDLGCGPCDKTAVLSRMGYHCSGVDDLNDPWHLVDGNRGKILAFAEASGVELKVVGANETLPFGPCTFDMVMMNDVLEHLHDSPREMLNDCCELLKPEGLLYVTVPNATELCKRVWVMLGRSNMPRYDLFYWSPGPWRGHVREYVKRDLTQLCTFLDLRIRELRSLSLRVPNALPRGLRPLYRLATWAIPGSRDTWSLVARKGTKWAPRRALGQQKLREVVGRATRYKH
jgi:SAM-dependent methyltransferase